MLRLLFKKSETTELRNFYFFFPSAAFKKLQHQQYSSHPHLLYIFLHASATVTIILLKRRNVLNLWQLRGCNFHIKPCFSGHRGVEFSFFNHLRLTPCKWSRCQTPINLHLREPTSVEDIVMKASPNLPHPVVSNCETVAYPSVECFVKEREESAIVLEEG